MFALCLHNTRVELDRESLVSCGSKTTMKNPASFGRFHISRRSFLKRCSVTAAAAGLPVWFVERELSAAEGPKLSPNDRPGGALGGCGGMGRGDATNASRFGDIIAVCDVDQKHLEDAAKQFTKDGKTPAKFNDFRKVMERNDVHVIIT